VAGGRVEPFDGDLDEYAAWLRSRPGSDNPKTPAPKAEPALAKPAPPPAPAKPKVNPHKLQKAEERVARLEGKLAECEAQMADPAVYADAGRVADIGRQQMQLRTELEAAEAELLALYD
jgi:ATP-binding cassette subfamily F protein 3